MVGRLWETELDAPLAAEFESYAGQIALPMVRGRMGCSAVFVLRDPSGRGRGILTFWLSRKAMAVASVSSEWAGVGRELARFGITFDLEHGRAFESVSHFFAGSGVP
jgi:hypothetical protein